MNILPNSLTNDQRDQTLRKVGSNVEREVTDARETPVISAGRRGAGSTTAGGRKRPVCTVKNGTLPAPTRHVWTGRAGEKSDKPSATSQTEELPCRGRADANTSV